MGLRGKGGVEGDVLVEESLPAVGNCRRGARGYLRFVVGRGAAWGPPLPPVGHGVPSEAASQAETFSSSKWRLVRNFRRTFRNGVMPGSVWDPGQQ